MRRPASPPRTLARAGTHPPAAPPRHLAALADLPPTATTILLDQFGVLHDGRAPYPGAVDAVRALAAGGRRLVVLSNSSRRAADALAKLAALGFDAAAFAAAVTSGEVAHARLAARSGAWWRGLGSRVLHVTWGARGAVSLAGLGLTPADAATADFILAHGTEAVAQPDGSLRACSLDEIKDVLRAAAAAARGAPPPFLCANPDLVTVDGGALRVMPGTLAAFYEAECGGRAVLLGKPGGEIYAAALAAVGDPPPGACLAVGDSLEHDVAGAARAGIDCLYIGGGIHARELGVGPPPTDGSPAPPVDADALAALLDGRPADQVPRYVKAYLAP